MTSAPRVIIVEDEVIVAMELRGHLERLGYRVLGMTRTGEDAIERARELSPDLLLMDIHLAGELDGTEAAAQIRAEQDVAVVFLTAYGDTATVERARKSGPSAYLVKPFEERELRAALEIALDRHRQTRVLRHQHDDLAQILDGLRIGTAMTDAEGRVTFVSRSAGRMLGAEPETLLGQPWAAAFGLDAAARDALASMMQRPAGDREKVPTRLAHDGRTVRVEIEVQDDPRTEGRCIFVLYDVTEVHTLRRLVDQAGAFHDLVGQSAAMQDVFEQIRAFAAVESTVLIQGETGTGKELVARALHDAGPRASGPFVAVNCAVLNRELVASMLFGHKRGAFTGASADYAGYFEAAAGGTVFLDEIGDLPPDVQVALLRVLEARTVTRVGETTPRPVDVRVVAATHHDLAQAAADGTFRTDLLYRLRVGRVTLPPLRQRREDIPLLVRTFLDQLRATMGHAVDAVSPEAIRALIGWDWPGNVRELRNAVEYAVVRARRPVLQPEHLPPEVWDTVPAPLDDDLDERGRILAALEQTDGNRTEAAALLGISRATLYRRLDAFDLT